MRDASENPTLGIQSLFVRRIAGYHYKRGDILADDTAKRTECIGTDGTVLVDQRETTKGSEIVNCHMTGKRCTVRENHLVADPAVMCNVRIGHYPVVVTDTGNAFILRGPPVDGNEFADNITVSQLQPGRLPRIFPVLRSIADRGKLVNPVIPADTGRAIDYRVGADPGTGIDDHIRADDREGPDIDISRQFRSGVNYSPRVDQELMSLSVHMISADETSLSSTLALQSKIQMPRFSLIRFALITSWSPGSTGCLKRTLFIPTRK